MNGKGLANSTALEAIRRDLKKVAQMQAESEGPVPTHRRHRVARALQIKTWLDAIGLTDLEDCAGAERPLPSFGAWIKNRPLDQEILFVDFGIRITSDEDYAGTRLTIALLRLIAVKTKRKQIRHGGRKGTREWVRVLDKEALEDLKGKAEPGVQRLLDPEKAREAWDTMELEQRLGVSRINDAEMIAALLDGQDAANTTPTPAAA